MFVCRKTYAQCYGGHQFGYWAGQLGDGRAISLGQVTGPGGTFELQLKVSVYSSTPRGAHSMAVQHTICSSGVGDAQLLQ